MKKKFLRRNWNKYKRLGLGRKKKQVWRRPRGKHSKMRKWRRGYPARVDAGYRSPREQRGKISGKIPVFIRNVQDLAKVGKDEIAIIEHIGKKKRNEILKKAGEMKIHVHQEVK